MHFITHVVLALGIPLLSGCAGLTSPARMHELGDGKGYWFDYDASRRGTVLVGQDPKTQKFAFRSCAEPAPDVALSLASKIESQLSYKEISGQAKGDLAINAVKLADRSQMVMFFREALFRLCEISINQNLSNGEITGLYTEIIKTALRLGSDKAIDADILQIKANLAQAEATISTAATARALAETEKVKANDISEKQKLQQKIEDLNAQITKAAEDKKAFATQLLSANQIKRAEVEADNTKATTAQVKGDEIIKDPNKAQPLVTSSGTN